MSTNTGCLFWPVLKIQDLKTLACRDEKVELLIFRTWSNIVKASTKKVMLGRKPCGPDLASQVPKLPKQMIHEHKKKNLKLMPYLVIFTAKYTEIRNKHPNCLQLLCKSLLAKAKPTWANSANTGCTSGLVSEVGKADRWQQGSWWGTACSVVISPHTSQLSPGTQHSSTMSITSPMCWAKGRWMLSQ